MHSDRYLIAFLCDNKNIQDFLIIENFFSNISNIALKVNDPLLMQLRLKWHIDALSKDYLKNSRTPYLEDLKTLINKYNLDSRDFIKIIEARTKDLDSFPFSSKEDILNYARDTENILWQNYGKIVGILDKDSQKAIEKSALAFTLVGMIRNYAYLSNRGIHNILYNENQLNVNLKANLTNNIKELIAESLGLIKDSNDNKRIHKKAKRMLLLNFITQGYIENIIDVNYDIYQVDNFIIPKKYYLKILLSYVF